MRSRLDLVVIAADPERDSWAQFSAWIADQQAAGAIDAAGEVRAADGLGVGAVRVRLDRWDRPALVANQVGGFRVRCPRCQASVVPAFVRAQEAYRTGGARTMRCPSCDDVVPLESLHFRPDAAYGLAALTLCDVQAAALPSALDASLRAAVGAYRVVARRV